MGKYRATGGAGVAILSTWIGAISTSPDTPLTVIHDQRDERAENTVQIYKHESGVGRFIRIETRP